MQLMLLALLLVLPGCGIINEVIDPVLCPIFVCAPGADNWNPAEVPALYGSSGWHYATVTPMLGVNGGSEVIRY